MGMWSCVRKQIANKKTFFFLEEFVGVNNYKALLTSKHWREALKLCVANMRPVRSLCVISDFRRHVDETRRALFWDITWR
jgi:hypothetical protein